MAFMLSFFLFGCDEIENKNVTEPITDSETSLVEKIDLSAISAPDEVTVYSASFFDRKPEEIAHIFLGNDFEEGETSAFGRMFISDAETKNEKFVYAYDSGRAFYGDNHISGWNGVNYVGCFKTRYYNNDKYNDMRNKYQNKGLIASEDSEEQNKIFSDKQKLIAEYLGKLGVNGYELYSAGIFNEKNMKGCLMYFKQMADGIPVSHMVFENSNENMVYNSRYSMVSEKIGMLDADVQVCFLEDKLADFYCTSLINIDKPLKKYPLISVNDAYEQVKKYYPVTVETNIDYELERAELQYALIMPDYSIEKILLYPVWLFCVHNEGDKIDSEQTSYMVDAITGELFSDISEELKELLQ